MGNNNWFKSNYALFVILFVAAVLRFFRVDYQSVWLDEIHTLNEANPNLSLSGLYDAILGADPHPPLYFIILNFVFKIFGYTTFVARMFSAVVGVAGIAGIYFLGKELFNNKVGVYASLLLAVNYFHLFYSQEARMYSLLFLTTTFSFYFLAQFIKVPTLKSALIYGISSTLMIYCHFFALFTLVSQYLILLFFVFNPHKTAGKKFLFYSAIAGITSLILYLPVWGVFQKAAERTTIWITMPTLDVYTEIFKEFFGQAELVIFFVVILVVIFFIQLSKETETNRKINPDEDHLVFSFLILFVWTSITLLIPLIRTYTALPMLISRYFINLLPAVILIIAIAVSYIRHEIVRYGILIFIFVFSLTDIIIVKKYYSKVDKEQFREVSQFVIDNNLNQDPVVSTLGWYFPFFLNNDKVKTTIVTKSLDTYVNEIVQDPATLQPFWHVEIGNHEPPLSDAARAFLNTNFVKEHSTKVFRGAAVHYSTIPSTAVETDISKFKPLKGRNGDDFTYYIDTFTIESTILRTSGFAYFRDQPATDSELELLLISEGKTYKIPSQSDRRDDVTTYFKSPHDLGNSGFSAKFSFGQLDPGSYQLAIILRNKTTKKEGLVLCDRYLPR
jgi:4-amino-4-deoxy-L-arabinose transferase-like glycosyltransferase